MEIFHDYGMHTFEFKTFKKKQNTTFRTLPTQLRSQVFLRMTYDSLSHPMLRQSSPKNITCHFNSSQKTIAERYALTQYFKNTRLDLRTSNILISSTLTVDQFISKTIILLRISHYCTEKYDLSSTYVSHDFSTCISSF